jgi:hypothetical protein
LMLTAMISSWTARRPANTGRGAAVGAFNSRAATVLGMPSTAADLRIVQWLRMRPGYPESCRWFVCPAHMEKMMKVGY